MQLILLIAMLLASGNGGDTFFQNVKPLLECIGGDDIKNALKSAEEFKGVLAALGSIGGFGQNGAKQEDDTFCKGENMDGVCSNAKRRSENTRTYASTNQFSKNNPPEYGKNKCGSPCEEECNKSGTAASPFVMAPVVHIADREIVYRLAQYFSEDEEKV